ncbi:MAG TPA: hypothetical protein VFF03_15020 [Rhodocyclaceae bacterium]|nr:hypothetical protein [Rhodocyclaceae bacterium]
MGVENRAAFTAVIGATGTGKGVLVKTRLLTPIPARLLVWDPMEEYGNVGRVVGLSEMARIAKEEGSFRLVFQPDWDDDKRNRQFELFCGIAFAAHDCTALVEELSLVTKPSWAPPKWRRLSNMGRHKGVQVIATAQRPAQVDKAFLGAATTIYCNRLIYPEDARVLSKFLGVTDGEIMALPDLHYIALDVRTREVTRGVSSIPRLRASQKMAEKTPKSKKTSATPPRETPGNPGKHGM